MIENMNTNGMFLIKLFNISNNISEIENKLSNISNNLDDIGDTAKRIHEENENWFTKLRKDAARKRRERKSQKYRSHS